jgi:hypothetical protein
MNRRLAILFLSILGFVGKILLCGFDDCCLNHDKKSFVVAIVGCSVCDHEFKPTLDSVFSQNYAQYRVVYVDDGYSKNVIDSINDYVKLKQQSCRFSFLHNEKSLGLIESLRKVQQSCSSWESVVPLREGDFFHDPEVLSSMNVLSFGLDNCILFDQFSEVFNANKTCIEKRLVVIIPSYNNSRYYKQNLDSVFNQMYQNYRIIYIDDASSDSTGALVENYVNEKHQGSRVTLIRNKQRVGALANIYNAIRLCEPNDIIINLDGDDVFFDNNVLAYINKIYQDLSVWMTYGQFRYVPQEGYGRAQQLPLRIIQNNDFRSYDWVTSAPRTFYVQLFNKIDPKDLRDQDGKFFKVAWDLAYMFPMLEMAGFHSRFIARILYDYNRSNAINDDKVNPELQIALDKRIRLGKKYQALAKLF